MGGSQADLASLTSDGGDSKRLRWRVQCRLCGSALEADGGNGLPVKRVCPLPRLNWEEYYDVSAISTLPFPTNL